MISLKLQDISRDYFRKISLKLQDISRDYFRKIFSKALGLVSRDYFRKIFSKALGLVSLKLQEIFSLKLQRNFRIQRMSETPENNSLSKIEKKKHWNILQIYFFHKHHCFFNNYSNANTKKCVRCVLKLFEKNDFRIQRIV